MTYQELMRVAYQLAADASTDTSTKNGALLVDPFVDSSGGLIKARGVNSFTDSAMASDPQNFVRPRKYQVTEHAERAAIYAAARQGVRTEGLMMFCPWACCSDCARAIVLAGIMEVVAHKQASDKTPKRWQEEVEVGMEILRGGGVGYHLFDAKIHGVENLFDGEVWYP